MFLKKIFSSKRWIIFLIVAILLEVILFNIRFWDSIDNQELNNYKISGHGINIDGNQLTVTEENGYLELYGFSAHISNLYLNVSNDEEDSVVTVNIRGDDATSSSKINTVDCGTAQIVDKVDATKYIRLHLREKSSFLRIYFNVQEGTVLNLDDLRVNCVQPFSFLWYRVAIIFVILIVVNMLRASSKLYKIGLFSSGKKEKLSILFLMILVALVLGGVTRAIRPSITLNEAVASGNTAQIQYNELTDAILDGHTYIDKDYVDELEKLDNPYDTAMRMELQEKTGHVYPWDYAYYDGKVYCYFGIVPVLFLFLPFKVITGIHLSPWNAMTVLSIIWTIVIFLFIYALCRRFFKHVSVGAFCVLSVFMVFACWTTNLIFIGNVYSQAQMFALLFGIFGLSCWLLSSNGVKIRKSLLILGSFCTALVSGCRPQLVLVIFLAFPIFWQEIRERKFFSKKSIANTLCVIVPIIFVAVGVMYYNFIRFDSPFDFGATYNLTGGDMVHRGNDWARLPLGLYQYLFKGIDTTSFYPFIKRVDNLNDYMGFTSFDEMFGGFFSYNLLCITCVLAFKLRNLLKKYKVYSFAVISIVMGIIICVLDIQVSGMTGRYLADFGWLFAIATILILIPIYQKVELKKYCIYTFDLNSVFKNVVLALVCLSVFLNLWSLLITDRYFSIVNTNPTLFYTIKSWLPFNI